MADSSDAAGEIAAPTPLPAFGAFYEARKKELEAERKTLSLRSDRISSWRGLFFLAMAGFGIAALARGLTLPVGLGLGLAVSAFAFFVVRHALLATEELKLEHRSKLADFGLARSAGELPDDTRRVPDPHGTRFLKADHAYAGDLDIFGKSSVFALLCRAETAIGEETLARWLLEPAPLTDVLARQEAIRELLKNPAFLEELAVRARQAESRGRAEDPLVAWAEAPQELPVKGHASTSNAPLAKRGRIILAAKIVVPLTLATMLGGNWLEAIDPRLGYAYVLPLGIQLALFGAIYAPVSRMITFVTSRESPFGRFRGLFRLVEDTGFETKLLGDLSATLKAGEARASDDIAHLERVLSFADLRHNTLIHLVANVFLLWDLWCAIYLERWRARSGRRVRKWLNAVGTLEALGSLARYAGENVDHSFPAIEDRPARFSAKVLGHPLLARKSRVANDVELDSPGRVLLITGSNMSGKSTFLRSMGLCIVMAMTGGVVCARRVEMSWMRVITSMRIGDSLEQGVSHFFAELLKLKSVEDVALADPRLMFLLDEILHGTNSRERTIGAKSVVTELSKRGAIGAVSSHDLGVATLEASSGGRVVNKHFSDLIQDGTMKFDYQLRDGIVRSTNALRLMRLVGLSVGDEESEARETAELAQAAAEPPLRT